MLRRQSLTTAAVPLAVGVGIYLLWLPTRWNLLVTAGMVMLAVGALAVVVSAALLVADLYRFRAAGAAPRAVLRRGLRPAALLAVTVATGVGIATLALSQIADYIVVLQNRSAVPIDRFTVEGGGTRNEWRDVKPGESRSVRLTFDRDDTLVYRADAGRQRHQGIIEGYVTTNQGGRTRIVYRRDGTFSR